MWSEGQWEALKKLHLEGTHTDRHTDGPTSQLLERIGLRADSLKIYCHSQYYHYSHYWPPLPQGWTCWPPPDGDRWRDWRIRCVVCKILGDWYVWKEQSSLRVFFCKVLLPLWCVPSTAAMLWCAKYYDYCDVCKVLWSLWDVPSKVANFRWAKYCGHCKVCQVLWQLWGVSNIEEIVRCAKYCGQCEECKHDMKTNLWLGRHKIQVQLLRQTPTIASNTLNGKVVQCTTAMCYKKINLFWVRLKSRKYVAMK